ncbi:hypothetical protein ACFL27_18815 [candidate division CSSED10-310 bacterium]|uniref:Uncharacterized protein n=1 Tax=candidate division CSSED10-310 bacterium TaxID=2855610 RepID=A0ABV6Z1T5_UNCC1
MMPRLPKQMSTPISMVPLLLAVTCLVAFPVLYGYADNHLKDHPLETFDTNDKKISTGIGLTMLVKLEIPPFKKFVSALCKSRSIKGIRLSELACKSNQITDQERWFRENKLSLPAKSSSALFKRIGMVEGVPGLHL